ncbi:3-oxoadipate enol-lactonase [Algicella marina]|uniref:3-oxoadipate enol-lactonase n=1 Tax=Algicella marina TaxID=2683284 RepID=A0A6P1SXY7_9RHOB|nr:3-oxoadipate enol-lactonase [Algicella marina]QHQ34500.1 3-oxoadipate enol-lactonase [Algicella marina]
MKIADLGDLSLHWREDGTPEGRPLIFANSLGTDLRLWDALLPLLPPGYRIIRFDKRGHGLSECPKGPYAMGALVRDAERLLDHLQVRDCIFVGLSIGGMIAQGLAVKRPDLVSAMVLSNTGAKLGTAQMWQDRMDAIAAGGISALSDAILERWFSDAFRGTPELALWRAMLERTPVEGYLGCCAAIAGTDFITPTSGLRLPTLGIAGSEDGASPPDVVREVTGLVPGARFALIRGAGHLPCVEKPAEYAAILNGFLEEL